MSIEHLFKEINNPSNNAADCVRLCGGQDYNDIRKEDDYYAERYRKTVKVRKAYEA